MWKEEMQLMNEDEIAYELYRDGYHAGFLRGMLLASAIMGGLVLAMWGLDMIRSPHGACAICRAQGWRP